MKFPIKQETELITTILSFANDPAAFVTYAYPWETDGTPLAKVKGPRRWQLDEIEAIAGYLIKAKFAFDNDLPLSIYRSAHSSGRGPGKSAALGMLAHWHISTHIGAQVVVSANTETQLRTTTMPEFASWITMSVNSHWFTTESMKIFPQPWLAKIVDEQLKINTERWNIIGQTWVEENPDAYVGKHNPFGLMVLFDEASGIPPAIWRQADGFFSDKTLHRYWLAMSQMRRNSGFFYDLFHDSVLRTQWRTRTLNTEGMDEVDQQRIKDFIALHGRDSDAVRVEVHGLPPNAGESQFITFDAVRAAQENTLQPDLNEPLIMGVDPAPRGRTVIRFRQGRNARDCVGKDTRLVLINQDNMQIAAEVVRLNNKYKPDAICVDFGMGTGVIDPLRTIYRLRVVEVKFGGSPTNSKGEWANKGTELWAAVRDWLPGGMIDKSPELQRDLTAREWEWSGREENKKVLESKEKLALRGVPSPDDADALACTFVVAMPRRDNPRTGGRRSVMIADGVERSRFDPD